MARFRAAYWALATLLSAACAQQSAEELAARAALEREVKSLREVIGRRERGEPELPEDDIIIVLSEDFIQDVLVAQLPFELDVLRFHVRLDQAKVSLQNSTLLRLTGSIASGRDAEPFGRLRVWGALEDIAADLGTGALATKVAVHQVELLAEPGRGHFVKRTLIEGLEAVLRAAIERLIPRIVLPVRARQSIVLPAIDSGPVQMESATLTLEGAVSGVVAGLGYLWVSLHVQAGETSKTADAGAVEEPP